VISSFVVRRSSFVVLFVLRSPYRMRSSASCRAWYHAPVARFAIDARVITAERDGVGRYARELVPALVAAAPGDDFLVLRHPSNRDPIVQGGPNVREAYVGGVVGHLLDHYLADHRRLRAVFDAEGWPDVYHSLFQVCARGVARWTRPRPAVVVTLHDLIWADHALAHGPLLAGLGTWVTAHVAIAGSLARADRVIAVSAATAAAAARWTRNAAVTVVHHGVGAAFRLPPPPLPAGLERLATSGTPYVTALGPAKKYKNLELVVRAFAAARREGLEASLVLVGQCDRLRPLADKLGVGDRVFLPGAIDDLALRAVVGGSALVVHPAFVEGFGLPVVEAMAMGAPTAVADVPALTEVGGDGVLRFDPRNERALAGIMRRLVGSEEARREWSVRARRRSEAFEWGRCARETLAVYRQAMLGKDS
jgi:glycosyltransferase involved in cell wall biosynthesis